MECQKVCKQGRDNIKKKPHPCIFSNYMYSSVKSTFTFISSGLALFPYYIDYFFLLLLLAIQDTMGTLQLLSVFVILVVCWSVQHADGQGLCLCVHGSYNMYVHIKCTSILIIHTKYDIKSKNHPNLLPRPR